MMENFLKDLTKEDNSHGSSLIWSCSSTGKPREPQSNHFRSDQHFKNSLWSVLSFRRERRTEVVRSKI